MMYRKNKYDSQWHTQVMAHTDVWKKQPLLPFKHDCSSNMTSHYDISTGSETHQQYSNMPLNDERAACKMLFECKHMKNLSQLLYANTTWTRPEERRQVTENAPSQICSNISKSKFAPEDSDNIIWAL